MLYMLDMMRARSRCFNSFAVLCRNITQHGKRTSSPQIIILTGATASGKSDIAMKFGLRRDIEIVVADSVQVVKYLNIGANKPTAEDMRMIPHHLVDIHEPGEFFSAADYLDVVGPVLHDIIARGKTPVIVGGNTMWVEWLLRGMPSHPGCTSETKRQAAQFLEPFKQSGNWDDAVSSVLSMRSPAALETPVSAPTRNDWYRLHRLLEIILTTHSREGSIDRESSDLDSGRGKKQLGERSPSVLSKLDCDVRCFFIGGERMRLYRDIDMRCERIVQAGVLEETTALLLQGALQALPADTSGITSTCPAPSAAIGYRQTVNYLCRSPFRPDDAAAFMKYMTDFATATRNYAKKQLHWYRKDDLFLWLHGGLAEESAGANNRVNSLCTELEYWTSVPHHQYKEATYTQFTKAKNDTRYGPLRRGMKGRSLDVGEKDGLGDRDSAVATWSAEGLQAVTPSDVMTCIHYLVRAYEGVRDPTELRRYTPHFPVFAPPTRPDRSREGSRNASSYDDLSRMKSNRPKASSKTILIDTIARADNCRKQLEKAGLLKPA